MALSAERRSASVGGPQGRGRPGVDCDAAMGGANHVAQAPFVGGTPTGPVLGSKGSGFLVDVAGHALNSVTWPEGERRGATLSTSPGIPSRSSDVLALRSSGKGKPYPVAGPSPLDLSMLVRNRSRD